MSSDARYISFGSTASNLAPNDTNGQTDIFVRDTVGNTTIRVNLATAGDQANGFSYIG